MAEPVKEAPEPAPPQTDARQPEEGAAVAAQIGWIEERQAFVLPLGAGVELSAETLGGGDKQSDIDLSKIPNLPGLMVEEGSFNPNGVNSMITLKGKTNIPLTEASDFTLRFRKAGTPRNFNVETKTTLDWMGNPSLTLGWQENEGVSARLEVEAKKLVPHSMRNAVEAEGDISLSLNNGRLTGAINSTVTVENLLETNISGNFGEGGLSATVALKSQMMWLGDVTGEGSINAAGEMSAKIEKPTSELPSPVPGLTFSGGTFSVSLNNDRSISGGFNEVAMNYAGMASAVVSMTIGRGKINGGGVLTSTIPGFSEVTGTLRSRNSKLSGALRFGKNAFPEGLPLENGQITGTVSETGSFGFRGDVGIKLGPAGSGKLEANYSEESGLFIGAEIDLSVPGLETAKFTIGYDGTDITGSGELSIDPELLSGITGNVKVTYEKGLWAGETNLGYSADNGKLAGNILVRVRQTEDDSLKVSGEGEVTAKIAPRLEGKLKAIIKEEGGIDVSGEILVTEPIEMFPEARFEKELLDISSKIPLWAILVAVLRVRAGVRAGIGPGQFRDIKITGSYTIGEEGEPSFAITGEMFIPAFVEGYVGFGAGLGLSVGLGSLTGGIEAMGTAGIYGAISVKPELAYENGDYSIEGVATMAAGARLKLGLNAWAEVEALWVTVWENTWELASFTMPMGPDLGMSAKMSYTFGKPEAPNLEFSASDIDTDALISQALPKDGPPPAGAKNAVKNEAKWQGAQREKGEDADRVPEDLQKQSEAAPRVAEPRAGRAPGSKREGPATTDPPENADPTAAGTVPEDKAADTKDDRYPNRITMATLNEPPAALPRSKEQQRADVRAAAEMVRVVSASVNSTDTLDDAFPQIKARFRLSLIEYVGKPGGVIKVRVKVNDETDVAINETIQSLNPAFAASEASEITFKSESVSFNGPSGRISQTVGTGMEANPLTPGHAQGTGPRGSSLSSLFGTNLLPTSGDSGAHSFIRGHLLNDNLGGEGVNKNLFPITAQANADHHSKIESDAKRLVNDEHYWVRYKVSIDSINSDVVGGTFFINSVLHAELAILTTDDKENVVKSVTVQSQFNTSALTGSDDDKEEQKEAFRAANTPQELLSDTRGGEIARVDTKNLDIPNPMRSEGVDQSQVLLSTASGDTEPLILTAGLRSALTTLRDAAGKTGAYATGGNSLEDRLRAVDGLGEIGVSGIIGSAGKALNEDTMSRGADIALKMTSGQARSLRAINNVSASAALNGVVRQFLRERAALASFTAKGVAVTSGDWQSLAATFATTPQKDRIAAAREIANQIGTARLQVKPSFKEAGGLSSDNAMFASLRGALQFAKVSEEED